MANLDDLTELDVIDTSVKITNTGDGLSKALQVEEVELHHRSTIHVLLECEVIDVQTPLVKDSDGVQRKHVLRAGRATILDTKAAEKALDAQDKKIEQAAKEAARAAEKAAGLEPLPGTEDL